MVNANVELQIMELKNKTLTPDKTCKIIFELHVKGSITDNYFEKYNDNDESQSFALNSLSIKNSDSESLTKSPPKSPSFYKSPLIDWKKIIKYKEKEMNTFIDDFNTKFHYQICKMYAVRLGLNLTFQKVKSQHFKISFSVDFKKDQETLNLNSSQLKINSITSNPKIIIKPPDELPKRPSIFAESYKNFLHIVPAKKKLSLSNLSDSRKKLLKLNEDERIIINSPMQIKKLETIDSSDKTRRSNKPLKFDYIKQIKTNQFVKNHCMRYSDDVDLPEEIKEEKESEAKETIRSKTSSKKEKSVSSPNLSPKNSTTIPRLSLASSKSAQEILKGRNKSAKFKMNNLNLDYNPKSNKKNIVKMNHSNRSFNQSFSRLSRKFSHISSLKESSFRSNDDLFRVLLCDDESLIRKTLHRFFNSFSCENPSLLFEVEHSDNGFECLDRIYKSYCNKKHFDLLIIDETMPFFRGSQIINLMKTMISEGNFRELIIISFTSYSSNEKMEYILSQGADFVVNKPLQYEEFKSFLMQNIFI